MKKAVLDLTERKEFILPLKCKRYLAASVSVSKEQEIKKKKRPCAQYQAVIVGAGHNGLTAAAYLSKAGRRVCVLERRSILGGAAVTEEIIPGFKFSRASYLLSLFRPQVMKDLRLKDFGLKYHMKDPSSFTPLMGTKRSLTLGRDMAENQRQIAQFSEQDAQSYPEYERMIGEIVAAIRPLIDREPLQLTYDSFSVRYLKQFYEILWKTGRALGARNALEFYQLLTAPISKILDRRFDSDVLKATLATDGIIGCGVGPHSPGTGYVLLHHLLGEMGERGEKGGWAVVEGGMGSVSRCLARAALHHSAQLFVDSEVAQILIKDNEVCGVKLSDGQEIRSDIVLSNATAKVTFLDLIEQKELSTDFRKSVKAIDYSSPVTKINVAVNGLPRFEAAPNEHHQRATIHLNCESVSTIQNAYTDLLNGISSHKPIIEMTIPSSIDRTLAPKHCHVVLLFTQYCPYRPLQGEWNQAGREQYAKRVFNQIDKYAPNFSSSVLGYEVLTPPDLESTFNLTGGNIFHGSMSLDQLYWMRPVKNWANYRTPVRGLYLCGSAAHPGGGVTGGPGRLAAKAVLRDTNSL